MSVRMKSRVLSVAVSTVLGMGVLGVATLSGCATKEVKVEAPQTQAEKPKSQKSTSEQIQELMQARGPDFAECYRANVQAAQPEKGAKGATRKSSKSPKSKDADVTTTFVINAEGKPTGTRIKSSTLKNKKAETCIVNVIKGMEFPKPETGKLEVNYPLKFTEERTSVD